MIKKLDNFLYKFNLLNHKIYLIILLFLFFAVCNFTLSQVTDIEGYTYPTVIIGEQEWKAENLKTGHFNDGTPIPLLISAQDWMNTTDAGACWYNNDSTANHQIYSRMYNGHAAMHPNICPEGWKVPTDLEWDELVNELGGAMFGGGSLKQTGLEYWEEPNAGATNSSGFTAYPSGWRSNIDGSYNWMGQRAGWFVQIRNSTDVAFRFVSWSMASAGSGAISQNAGLCIRCFRNVANSIDKSQNSPIIFPNPAEEYIEIIQPSEGPEIRIYNVLGECVLTESIHPMSQRHRMYIEHLPVGTYIIQIGNYSQNFMVIR